MREQITNAPQRMPQVLSASLLFCEACADFDYYVSVVLPGTLRCCCRRSQEVLWRSAVLSRASRLTTKDQAESTLGSVLQPPPPQTDSCYTTDSSDLCLSLGSTFILSAESNTNRYF